VDVNFGFKSCVDTVDLIICIYLKLCLALYLIRSRSCPTVVCETRSVPFTKFCICFPLGVCKLCSSPLHSSACLPVVKFMSARFLTHWQNNLAHALLLQAMFFLLFIVLH
jgi:hypothetical protein